MPRHFGIVFYLLMVIIPTIAVSPTSSDCGLTVHTATDPAASTFFASCGFVAIKLSEEAHKESFQFLAALKKWEREDPELAAVLSGLTLQSVERTEMH